MTIVRYDIMLENFILTMFLDMENERGRVAIVIIINHFCKNQFVKRERFLDYVLLLISGLHANSFDLILAISLLLIQKSTFT